MIELKPCPFCGNKPNINIISQWVGDVFYRECFYVKCNKCKIESKILTCREDAVSDWNTRSPILKWRSAAEKPEENKEVMIDIGYNCIEIIIYWEENIEYWKQVERWVPLSEVLAVIK